MRNNIYYGAVLVLPLVGLFLGPPLTRALSPTPKDVHYLTQAEHEELWRDPPNLETEEPIMDDVKDWWKTQHHTTVKYGCPYDKDCDYLAVLNAQYLAEDKLWNKVRSKNGTLFRAPCGGSIDCPRLLAENVQCYVEVGDCGFKPGEGGEIDKTFILDCRGDDAYAFSRNGCVVTKVVKGRVEY